MPDEYLSTKNLSLVKSIEAQYYTLIKTTEKQTGTKLHWQIPAKESWKGLLLEQRMINDAS